MVRVDIEIGDFAVKASSSRWELAVVKFEPIELAIGLVEGVAMALDYLLNVDGSIC